MSDATYTSGLELQVMALRQRIAELEPVVAAATEHIKELEADKRRLDWIVANQATVRRVRKVNGPNTEWRCYPADGYYAGAPTIREAIDRAAIAQSGEGGGG